MSEWSSVTVDGIVPKSPVVVRFDVGQEFFKYLMKFCGGGRPQPGVDVIFGVPLFVDESMPADSWRALDRDGNVISEGGLE